MRSGLSHDADLSLALLDSERAETKMVFRRAPIRFTKCGAAQALSPTAPLTTAAQLGGGAGSPENNDHSGPGGTL